MRRVVPLVTLLAASFVLAAPGAAAARTTPRGFFGVMVNGVLGPPSDRLGGESAAIRRPGRGAGPLGIPWDLGRRRRGHLGVRGHDPKEPRPAREPIAGRGEG